MDDYLTTSLESIEGDPRLDASAKKLLSNKKVLALILRTTVPEFSDMEIADIIPHIEGEPYVSQIRLEPGLTNKTFKEAIIGNTTENAEPGEGRIFFDIVFYVRLKDGLSRILINVEAQKNEKPGYPLIKRTVFYECRLIASQKEREFVKSEYDKIIPTYSIWICTSMDQNCMNVLELQNRAVVGDHDWGTGCETFNIVLIGVKEDETKEMLENEKNELHQVLGTLFSNKLNVQTKEELLEPVLQVQNDQEFKKELTHMCNISYGIAEKNFKKGVEEKTFEMIKKMLKNHESTERIKMYTDATDEEIEKVREFLLVK